MLHNLYARWFGLRSRCLPDCSEGGQKVTYPDMFKNFAVARSICGHTATSC